MISTPSPPPPSPSPTPPPSPPPQSPPPSPPPPSLPHVWAQLSVASSAVAARLLRYFPASIYARLVVASSVALAATLDLFELAFCWADEMLSISHRFPRLVLKPARMAFVLTSAAAGPLRFVLTARLLPSPVPYELYLLESPKSPPKSWRRPIGNHSATAGFSTAALLELGAVADTLL